MFRIEVKVDKGDLVEIKEMPKQVKRGLLKGLRLGMFEAERVSKARMGKSEELQVRTGALRRSIESGVDKRGSRLIGWLGSNIVYARIHEFGGIIRAHGSGYLRFPIGDSWVSVKQVRIPPRPYLEPSIMEAQGEISKHIIHSIIKEVEHGK